MILASGLLLSQREDYFSVIVSKHFDVTLHVSTVPLLFVIAVVGLLVAFRHYVDGQSFSSFEIDSAEFGLGDHKVSLKPNNTDVQIAYSIWVELSTRKIGLPIDLDNDVIVEIYDSWYSFFAVTRELIKTIPVSKTRNDSTRQIIEISISVLNLGLRPHLTKWQARFRHWYDSDIEGKKIIEPQETQKKFPSYKDLAKDLMVVNQNLINYRKKMRRLALGESEESLW
jgi:hypothetical protein